MRPDYQDCGYLEVEARPRAKAPAPARTGVERIGRHLRDSGLAPAGDGLAILPVGWGRYRVNTLRRGPAGVTRPRSWYVVVRAGTLAFSGARGERFVIEG